MKKFFWTSALNGALLLLHADMEAKIKMNNSMNKSIIRQIIELESKSSIELRQIHNNLFGEQCQPNASKEHLRPKLAYRLQELAIGGLDDKTKEKLESVAKGKSVIGKAKHSDLLPGTKICKEYNDVEHQVEVMSDCFEYNGQKWNSLSAIATKITGTKWNGPRFFGLRG